MLVTRPNPHPGTLACPSTPEMLQIRECTPTFFFSIVFTFKCTFESFKECGVMSLSLWLGREALKSYQAFWDLWLPHPFTQFV